MHRITSPAASPSVPPRDSGSSAEPAEAVERPRGPHSRARILSVSPSQKDHTDLRHILSERYWHVVAADKLEDVIRKVSHFRPHIVLCERDLSETTWQDVLTNVIRMPDPPPLIVTSRLADECLWAEVLNLGGYDVLVKPFRNDEVRRVLEFAFVRATNPVRFSRAAGTAARPPLARGASI
ncbi:MAG TPA: response regulator [Bryobacteraceae bacterium]|nr:response regulator [Bryobacteraceae bacterium]